MSDDKTHTFTISDSTYWKLNVAGYNPASNDIDGFLSVFLEDADRCQFALDTLDHIISPANPHGDRLHRVLSAITSALVPRFEQILVREDADNFILWTHDVKTRDNRQWNLEIVAQKEGRLSPAGAATQTRQKLNQAKEELEAAREAYQKLRAGLTDLIAGGDVFVPKTDLKDLLDREET